MKNYKFINLDNLDAISSSMYTFLKDQTTILDNIVEDTGYIYHRAPLDNIRPLSEILPHVPLIEESLASLGLTLTYLVVLIVPENFGLSVDPNSIHIDHAAKPRIVVPIKNCKGSCTEFYDIPTKFFELTQHQNRTLYYKFIPGMCEVKKIDEFELTSALVINPNAPHGIRRAINSVGPRISLILNVEESLDSWLD